MATLKPTLFSKKINNIYFLTYLYRIKIKNKNIPIGNCFERMVVDMDANDEDVDNQREDKHQNNQDNDDDQRQYLVRF